MTPNMMGFGSKLRFSNFRVNTRHFPWIRVLPNLNFTPCCRMSFRAFQICWIRIRCPYFILISFDQNPFLLYTNFSNFRVNTRKFSNFRFAPVGIISLIAGNLIELDDLSRTAEGLMLYLLTILAGLMIHWLITTPILYIILTRKNPFIVARTMLQAFFTALGTSSR